MTMRSSRRQVTCRKNTSKRRSGGRKGRRRCSRRCFCLGRTSVAAIASNSSRLARREDQVYDTLDGLEASLSTAASISNAMAQKSDEPESTET
eukprot:scaffold79_cov259-Pinguiococcus_pyrenoidosus.AAC.36